MFTLAIQSFLQAQYKAGTIQIIIALGFLALLIRNIIAVRNHKQSCSTSACGGTNWLHKLFKKKEK
jgi:hypothetical protein